MTHFHHSLLRRRALPRHGCRQGSVIVLIAFLLPVLIILAGFAINSATIELRRTEMLIAADAAARAGGRELSISQSESAATAKARQFARLNEVAGEPLDLATADIVFGRSQRQGAGRYTFAPDDRIHNAIQIIARRDANSSDGPIPMPFPIAGGTNSVPMSLSSISTQVDIDLALVIDRSGSMAYASTEVAQFPPYPRAAPRGWKFGHPAPPKSRWRDLVKAIKVFDRELESSPGDELAALVTYSNRAKQDQHLTRNLRKIEASINRYTRSFQSGSTNIGGGILAATQTLVSGPNARPGAVKVIVVMTDGIHNTGTDPVSAAKTASNQGIMIFSVTFSNEADQRRMRKVASAGKGKHFHARNGEQLSQVFREIAKQLPTLLTK